MILNTKDSVSLHIRRGDYLKDDAFVKLGFGYYAGALKALHKRVKQANIFIFSDDMQWCKKYFLYNVGFEFTKTFTFTFIDHNSDENAAFDLELMKSCKHNIIANSTFSYWAAYLNDNPHKIVIVPNKILQTIPTDAFKNHENKIYEKGWIKIEYIWGYEL